MLWQHYWLVIMKKLFILLFDQLETDIRENIDSLSGNLWATRGETDLPLTNKELQFCFSLLLNHFLINFFDWNCCVDIGSKGKIWKSVQNSLFHWKREDNLLGDVKYPFLNKHLTFLGLFQSNGKDVLIKNMVHRCVF